MKMFLIIMAAVFASVSLSAQGKKAGIAKAPVSSTLPDLSMCILQGQEHVSLFVRNLDSNAKEKDVNSIIVDFQKYIDSLPPNRSQADALLAKHFAALRMFFLTTTNKTTVATSFLSEGPPFRFCTYSDTASVLYLGAVKDGELYNLSKMTEEKVVNSVLMNCLLPSVKALDEFRNNEVKYVALSTYYGCRDIREGAPASPVAPFCLTIVASLADIQQYNSGSFTAKGLLEHATLYLSGAGDYLNLRKIQADLE